MVDTEEPYDCSQQGEKGQKRKRQKQSQQKEKREDSWVSFCAMIVQRKKKERKYSASVVMQQKYEVRKADKCTEDVNLTF